MKHIASILLLLSVRTLPAQTPYHPMLVEGRSWDIFQVPTDQSICSYQSAGHYFLKGDTVLNGRTYQKLYFENILSNPPFPFCSGFYRDTTEHYLYYAFFREDTLTRRVYRYSSSNPAQDDLLFDFSLQAGDTLHYAQQSYPILEVLDFELANGSHRKALKIGEWWSGSNMYVESLGYLFGAFDPVFYPFEGFNVTTCVRDGNETLYSNDVGCILATSSTQSPALAPIQVYPNPFFDQLVLKTPPVDAVILFDLFDINGRKVLTKEIPQGTSTYAIELPPLPKGAYVWTLAGFFHGKLAKTE